ncbi:MAG TPA: glycerol-3-phosphate dehydrogenase [Terriglobia bacterium]|nr:glycerol-3-phosphate dehydrogenase [Terriglobia bacterium]
MKRDLDALGRQQFDLVVIGGGIHGAATARDAALGGLSVALLEARDFASGTSSRSTKLIHGGLRYLEHYEFALVREARQERRRLLKMAPHLARPLPFLLPIYRGDPFSPLKVRLGLAVYDLLGNLGPGDRHRMLAADEAVALMPALRRGGLRAAALYHDSGTDDARLTIENVIDAADHGAVVANYAEVRAVAAQGGRVTAVEVEDALTGRQVEVSGRYFVNATGPWVDRLRALLPGFDGSRTVRLTKGVHLVVPPVTGRVALLAAVPGEDRVFLMWPWHGGAMLGTTDTDYEGDPAAVAPEPADTEYLLRAANRVFAEPLRPADVRCPWAGLRALVLAGADPRKPSAVTREYRFHEDRWAANLITVCGGKLTTARALGEKLARQAAHRLGTSLRGASSRTTPFPGGRTGPFEAFVSAAVEEARSEFRLGPAVAARIVRTYGRRWRTVLEPVRNRPELAEPLPAGPPGGPPEAGAPLLAAEAAFAIEHEMVLTVEDFLLRRSGLSWTGSLLRDAVPVIGRMLAAQPGSHGVEVTR